MPRIPPLTKIDRAESAQYLFRQHAVEFLPTFWIFQVLHISELLISKDTKLILNTFHLYLII